MNTILSKASCLTFTTTCRKQLLLLFYREIWDWVLAILLICGNSSLCYIPLKNAVFQQAIKLLRLKLHMFFQPVTWGSFSLSSLLFSFFPFHGQDYFLYAYVVEGPIRGHPGKVTMYNSGFPYFAIIYFWAFHFTLGPYSYLEFYL